MDDPRFAQPEAILVDRRHELLLVDRGLVGGDGAAIGRPFVLAQPGRRGAAVRHVAPRRRIAQRRGNQHFRVTAGFLLSAAIALPLGLVIGAYRPVRAFFEPLLEFARYLPAVAFVPMVLLWTGIGESSKILVIWIGTFFQMVIMLTEDVGRVPCLKSKRRARWGRRGGKS